MLGGITNPKWLSVRYNMFSRRLKHLCTGFLRQLLGWIGSSILLHFSLSARQPEYYSLGAWPQWPSVSKWSTIVQELIAYRSIDVAYKPTNTIMITDILTKPLITSAYDRVSKLLTRRVIVIPLSLKDRPNQYLPWWGNTIHNLCVLSAEGPHTKCALERDCSV